MKQALLIILIFAFSCKGQNNNDETTPDLPPSRAQTVSKGNTGAPPKLENPVTPDQSTFDGMTTGLDGSEQRPWIGAANPLATVYVFSDYQCPFCSRANISFRSFLKQHSSKIRLVHVHLPLAFHRHAATFAKFAICAAKKGKFWLVNDYIYGNARTSLKAEDIAKYAGLDTYEFSNCVKSSETEEHLKKDLNYASSFQIRGTPTFRYNGKNYYLTTIITELKSQLQIK